MNGKNKWTARDMYRCTTPTHPARTRIALSQQHASSACNQLAPRPQAPRNGLNNMHHRHAISPTVPLFVRGAVSTTCIIGMQSGRPCLCSSPALVLFQQHAISPTVPLFVACIDAVSTTCIIGIQYIIQ